MTPLPSWIEALREALRQPVGTDVRVPIDRVRGLHVTHTRSLKGLGTVAVVADPIPLDVAYAAEVQTARALHAQITELLASAPRVEGSLLLHGSMTLSTHWHAGIDDPTRLTVPEAVVILLFLRGLYDPDLVWPTPGGHAEGYCIRVRELKETPALMPTDNDLRVALQLDRGDLDDYRSLGGILMCSHDRPILNGLRAHVRQVIQ